MRFVAFIKGQFNSSELIGASSVVLWDKDKTEVLYQWAKGRKCNQEKKNRSYEQELGSVIKAVMSVPKGSSIELYSNQQILVRCLKGEYEPSSYLELFEKFVQEKEHRHVDVDFRWVKGDPDDPDRQLADSLCLQVSNLVRESGKSEIIETENHCFDGEDMPEDFFKLP